MLKVDKKGYEKWLLELYQGNEDEVTFNWYDNSHRELYLAERGSDAS